MAVKNNHDQSRSRSNADIVRSFWEIVWNEKKTDEIDRFMTEDFIIHTGGESVSSRHAFKAWVEAFQSKIDSLVFHVDDVFQSGEKVTSRWRITGVNRGFMGTKDNRKPICFTGITISVVNEGGQILEKWVERSAWELFKDISE